MACSEKSEVSKYALIFMFFFSTGYLLSPFSVKYIYKKKYETKWKQMFISLGSSNATEY